MSAWPEIASAALLGTQRRDPTGLGGPIPVTHASAEEHLLTVAATTAVARLAGATAAAGATPLPPSGDEALPRCSEAAALRLAAILHGDFGRVLDEWIALAARAGVRAPEEMLPAILRRGGADRDAFQAVIGERGRWLAPLVDEDALATDGDEVWETGTPAERRHWLERARRADPAAARVALDRTWRSEDARDRAAFALVLAEGLSPDDEVFLESALDDRSQAVRSAAATVLSALPGSAFQRRATERARAHLAVGRRLRSRLEVRLPAALDEEARRDLVDLKPPQGTGERAWWLSRMIRTTPLPTWEQELGLPPETIAGLPVADDLGPLVHASLVEAAHLQRSATWAEALLTAGAATAHRLLPLVPRESAERHAARILAADGGVHGLLDLLPRPWGLELSRTVVTRLVLDREIALALDPRVLDDLPPDAPPGVVTLLSFRHDLIKELTP